MSSVPYTVKLVVTPSSILQSIKIDMVLQYFDVDMNYPPFADFSGKKHGLSIFMFLYGEFPSTGLLPQGTFIEIPWSVN